MSGARAALDYFQVPDAEIRVDAYAERKQQMVLELIEAGKFTAFPDALRLVLALRDREGSARGGVVVEERRADARTDPAGHVRRGQGLDYDFVRPDLSLLELFDVDISGRDFEHGKPDPEIFLTAATELDLLPRECFVVEDAVAGVQAAKAGGIAALGVARADDVELLIAAERRPRGDDARRRRPRSARGGVR